MVLEMPWLKWSLGGGGGGGETLLSVLLVKEISEAPVSSYERAPHYGIEFCFLQSCWKVRSAVEKPSE